MRALPAILLAISSPALAASPDSLIGNWKLVSSQVVVEGQPPQDLFGSNPRGYLVLTPEGCSIVLTTADGRTAGMGDAERLPCTSRCLHTPGNTVSKEMTSLR